MTYSQRTCSPLTNLILSTGLVAVLLASACQQDEKPSNRELSARGWMLADSILEIICPPSFPARTFELKSFGARNDGLFNCTEAFRLAIDACNSAGGGTVRVAPGTYLSAAIHLKSNVNLYLEKGSKIVFIYDPEQYLPVVLTRYEGMDCMNYSPLIYAVDAENIGITGEGELNGQGTFWWSWKGPWKGSVKNPWKEGMASQQNDNKTLTDMVEQSVSVEKRVFGRGHFLRPNFIQTYRCRNVLIEGISINNSPMWNIHPVLCRNVIIRNVAVESLGPNNDGCDPESCGNVLIENCTFNTGDDCIAIKSGRNEDGRKLNIPSENIIIRNCRMMEGHGGVVIGSEISGNVRNVFAENCNMNSKKLERGLRIKSNSYRGGIVENIFMRNTQIQSASEAAILIDMYYSNETGPNYPQIRNVYVEGLTCNSSKYPFWIKAYKERPVENLVLVNCSFNNTKQKEYIENLNGLILENVMVNGKELKISIKDFADKNKQ